MWVREDVRRGERREQGPVASGIPSADPERFLAAHRPDRCRVGAAVQRRTRGGQRSVSPRVTADPGFRSVQVARRALSGQVVPAAFSLCACGKRADVLPAARASLWRARVHNRFGSGAPAQWHRTSLCTRRRTDTAPSPARHATTSVLSGSGVPDPPAREGRESPRRRTYHPHGVVYVVASSDRWPGPPLSERFGAWHAAP